MPDLQEALKAYPDRPELHTTLAEAYTHLGLGAVAAEHKQRAESLQKARKAKASP